MLFATGTENGDSKIYISEDVIGTIVYNTVKDVDGVSDLAARKPTDIRTKVGQGEVSRGVKLSIHDNGVQIGVSVKIKNTASIPKVSLEVQKSVKDAVQSMTGKIVTRVDVSIVGVDFPEIAAQ